MFCVNGNVPLSFERPSGLRVVGGGEEEELEDPSKVFHDAWKNGDKNCL
jgi:hypothetical protein